jgi:AcrR family transcriptional regulator
MPERSRKTQLKDPPVEGERPASSDDLSLRSRKKIRTRQQIADAAATLFAERGYDAVTVAEVARRAEVSEQTVYNFFSSKEQLVLDEEGEFEARLLAMVRERSPGIALADAVRAGAHAFLDDLSRRPGGPQRKGSLPYLINVSPTLRRAWLDAVDRFASSVARALIATGSIGTDGKDGLSPLAAKLLGLAVVGVFAGIVEEIGRAMKEGANLRTVIKGMRQQVDDAVGRIAPALNSVG